MGSVESLTVRYIGSTSAGPKSWLNSDAQRPANATGRDFPGHWEADLMLFKKSMDRPSSPPTSAGPGFSSSPDNQAKPPSQPPGASTPGSSLRHHSCARPSPSTTAPSSPSTTASKPSSASKPSPAIPTAPGKKVASKTLSDACDGPCPAKPTSSPPPSKPHRR